MAFVFRSEKRNCFDGSCSEDGKDVEEQPTAGESQLREKPKVWKGMPYVSVVNNNTDKRFEGWKQGESFNTDEALPIHLRVGHICTKKPMKLRECLPYKTLLPKQQNLLKFLSTSELKPQMFVECEETASQSNVCLKTSQNIKNNTKKVPHIQSSSTMKIVNKNLKKTLEQLQINIRGYQSINLKNIGDDREKQNGGQSNKMVHQLNWKSLKRLSPIRQYSHPMNSLNDHEKGLVCVKKTSLPQSSQKSKCFKKKVLIKPEPMKVDVNCEQQEGQYENEATPGPGSYQYDCQRQKQFRSKRQKFQKIFISPLQRFQGGQFKFQQVTYVNESDAKPTLLMQSKSCQSFLSKSPKFMAAPIKSQNPPPGYYDTRQNLQHELVRKILRSSNTNTFINRSPRIVLPNNKQELPGPGCYNIDRSPQKISEQKGKSSFCFKSQLERNLDYCPRKEIKNISKEGDIGLNLTKQTEKGRLIHVKDSVLEDLYVIQRPPFLTATSRFPDETRDQTKIMVYPTKQAFPVVHSPSKQPFNSSQKRSTLKSIGEGVGIGLYNMQSKWTKKSYNVLFN